MSACIVCGGNDARPFLPGLLRCGACGHGWADLQLSPEQLAGLYRRDYFFGDEYLDYVADRAIIQKNFRLRLSVLERFLDPARHRRLLEVGCAYGFFLDLARERFESATGIDITEDGVRYARETLGLDAVPTARSIERLGALSSPSVIAQLRRGVVMSVPPRRRPS